MKRNKNIIANHFYLMSVTETHAENAEELVDEDEYNAWHELRLHPLLMKAIYKLGFKQPTPIQKACIPAAAHQGKVCTIYRVLLSSVELFTNLRCRL